MRPISEEERLRMVFEAADHAARTLAAINFRLQAVATAAKELVDLIERYRPLDGPWGSEDYGRIHDAQDRVLEALRQLDDKDASNDSRSS